MPYLVKGCLIFFIVALIFSGIGSCCMYVADKWEERGERKIERADKKTTRKIDKALSKRDFETARELYYELNQNEEEVKEKIDITQLNYHLDNGDLEIAENVSREFDCAFTFYKLLKSNFSKYLRDKKYETLVDILSAWPFEYVYQVTGIASYYNNIDDLNKNYNDEAQEYNQMIDKLVTALLWDADLELARKCLILYKPIAKLKSKVKLSDGSYECTFRLSNVSGAIAAEKIKEYKKNM